MSKLILILSFFIDLVQHASPPGSAQYPSSTSLFSDVVQYRVLHLARKIFLGLILLSVTFFCLLLVLNEVNSFLIQTDRAALMTTTLWIAMAIGAFKGLKFIMRPQTQEAEKRDRKQKDRIEIEKLIQRLIVAIVDNVKVGMERSGSSPPPASYAAPKKIDQPSLH